MEDFEAMLKLLVEMTSWLDWWTITLWGLANSSQPDGIAEVHYFFTAKGKIFEHLSNAFLTLDKQ